MPGYPTGSGSWTFRWTSSRPPGASQQLQVLLHHPYVRALLPAVPDGTRRGGPERYPNTGHAQRLLTDDNITHDIPHFRRVCQAITDNGLNDMLYAVQVSAAGIANNPDLVKDMARANFRLAFVGFESMLPSALKNMNKPTTPDINRRAAKLLKENQIGILAGIIAGYPDDTAETIRQSFDHFLALNPDMIWPQYLTPYPKTVLRDEMLKDGLVANVDDFTKYDGFTCNTRTRHLSQSELYGCLKRQAFRAYLTPSLIFQNYFIRNYLWSFLGGQIINLAATIGYILRGNQGRALSTLTDQKSRVEQRAEQKDFRGRRFCGTDFGRRW